MHDFMMSRPNNAPTVGLVNTRTNIDQPYNV